MPELAKKRWRLLARKWFLRVGIGLTILLTVGWFSLRWVPIPIGLTGNPVRSVEFLDRNGISLREAPVDQRFSKQLAYDEVPERLRHAFLAAEDKRFFEHSGVDCIAALRAFRDNAAAGRTVSGASTITQQLVKTAAPRPRSLKTKLIEIATALRLEQLWTKEQIFTAYLNRLDFGNLNYGVVSAAQYYFGKPLSDLSEAECAFVAGLPWNPARLNPHRNLEGAKQRQQTVLSRMKANGWLSEDQYGRASREVLRLKPPGRIFNAPHFVDALLQSDLPKDVTTFQTTLDLNLNRHIEKVVEEKLSRLSDKNVRNAAVVVIENKTGGVMGLVGSENYFSPASGQFNGALAGRSAGSTLKPFVYLMALERGDTPATVIADVPTEFVTGDGPYRPDNYDRHCYGPVRYRNALACSLNIPAVKLLQSLGGAGALQKQLQAWGVTTFPKEAHFYGLGLAIGNSEVKLLELANAYATLARLGEWRPCQFLQNEVGTTPPLISAPKRPSLESCWLLADMLSDDAARSMAFGTNSLLHFDFPVACKTGTSTDFRDNWTMAFTPEFTVGVWVGNFDGSAMREVSGVTGAAPIMHDVMKYLHQRFGTSWYPKPDTIVQRNIHPLSGKIVSESRPGTTTELFDQRRLPAAESPDDYDESGRLKLGSEYAAWAESADNNLTSRIVAAPDGRLYLVSPQPGSTFVVDPDIPTSRFVPLTVKGTDAVEWQSETLQFQLRDGRNYAIAAEGLHKLTARDPKSAQAVTTWIRVKEL